MFTARYELGLKICYTNFVLQTAVTWHTRLDASFQSPRAEVEPRIVHVGFMVEKLALIQVVSAYFGIPLTVLLDQYSIPIFNFKSYS